MGNGSVIVIGGGVGPMAGVALHAKIIENTLSDGTDQSHLSVHHYSCSELVPDRTEYLLGRSRDDPASGMARVFEMASRALGDTPAVGGVPCNTFHAPAIFDRFVAEAHRVAPGIRIVDMLGETMGLLNSRLGLYPTEGPALGGGAPIGVLSTTGTRHARVYDELLLRSGYRVLYVPETDQETLHACIYDPSWGLKAIWPASERAVGTVSSMCARLVDGGAIAVILACTELPLAIAGSDFRGVALVDPMLALARALIREAAPEKLKPL